MTGMGISTREGLGDPGNAGLQWPSAAKRLFMAWLLGVIPVYITVVHCKRQYGKEVKGNYCTYVSNCR